MAAPHSLTGLIDTLEAEAEAELAHQREVDGVEAERIRAAARAEAERILEAAVAAVESDMHRRSVAMIGQARSQVGAWVRDEREATLEAVRDAARARLGRLRDRPDYDEILRALLREALSVLPAADTVHVDPRDAARADAALHAGTRDTTRPPRVVADLATGGGVAVSGGGRRVDNTVETRLEAAWPQLRVALVRSWAPDREDPS
jgi:vacuolar-type H+-ATPase subunit E/Vma4